MDNFRIDITSDDDLEAALALAFKRWKGATHWCDAGDDGLIFYWHRPESNPRAVELPTTMDASLVAPLVKAWLTTKAVRPPDFDFDGSVEQGFRVHNHSRAKPPYDLGWDYAICAVQPVTALYGK